MVPRTFRSLLALTAGLGGAPFLFYGWARWFGHLPAEAEWFRINPETGFAVTNHGPWYGDWQTAVILCPTVLLALLTLASLLVSLAAPFGRPTLRSLLRLVALLAAQMGALVALGTWLWWTID